jgi:two-component system NtrC family response regulator
MKRSAVTEEDDQRDEQRMLLVEDDLGLQKQMRWALSPYVVDLAASRTEALEKVSGFAYRVIVLDLG